VRFSKLSALPNIIARLRRVFDLAADPDAIALQLTKILRWRRSWMRASACACPARGTGLSWRCAPSWANRSPFPPLLAWPADWSPASVKSFETTTRS
jgi:hypothetical protein